MTNSKRTLAFNIAQKYGSVKRARGCFLYTEKRVRLTDLYQEGGRAILGWGAKGTFTVLKNVLDRGITGSFLTDFSSKTVKCKSQLSRAVSTLFASDRTAFVFSSKSDALKAALAISKESTSVFKPWISADVKWSEIDCVIFAPALPWTDNIFVLAAKSEFVCNGHSSENAKCHSPARPENLSFDFESELSAPLCAAVTRSVYDLIKALQEREEKNWFIYDKILTKYWTRKGPYLFPKIPEEKYRDFVIHCLTCELVISPDFNVPSIVPFGADTGVFRKLEKNPFSF